MKAVILVGGEGTRLRPMTIHTPKAMVPVVNRPFLEHMIEHLKAHQIRDIILALGYLPRPIQAHFNDGLAFGVKLTYIVEDTPLGTAGAVQNVASHLDGETFLVLNGDVFSDLDLTAMLAFHREKKAMVTIALTPVDDPTRYGVVETGSEGRVLRFVEKPPREEVTTNLINAGAYFLEPQILSHIPKGVFYMFEQGLFPLLLSLGAPVYGYPSQGYWIDIGTPEKYLALNRDILQGRTFCPALGRSPLNGLWLAEGCEISPLARVSGPVVLGEGCVLGAEAYVRGPAVLGPGCRLGQQVMVEEAVLWREVTVKDGAIIRGSIVGRGSIIEKGSLVEAGSVLGDGVTVERGSRVESGTRLWPEIWTGPKVSQGQD
ncbi:MAG: NDP-sugar synthase [Chloroflexi bacterium]|nr:NDP-sugar synthase [Chloroflexota bacterium]